MIDARNPLVFDMSNTRGFHRLAADYGHAMSRRFMVGKVFAVDHSPGVQGPSHFWVALYSPGDLRRTMTMRLAVADWNAANVEGETVVGAITPEAVSLETLIPGAWLGTLSAAASGARDYAAGRGVRVTFPKSSPKKG